MRQRKNIIACVPSALIHSTTIHLLKLVSSTKKENNKTTTKLPFSGEILVNHCHMALSNGIHVHTPEFDLNHKNSGRTMSLERQSADFL